MAFWVLYGSYFSIRLGYLCYSRLTLSRRWSKLKSLFVVHAANARSISRAKRHELWAFLWGNVGLVVRCGKQFAFIELVKFILAPFTPMLGKIPGQWQWAALTLLLPPCVYFFSAVGPALFYKIHRTIHENGNLYKGLHKIHHKGIYTSLLDSGTESPAEFFLTETPSILIVLPTWLFVISELLLMNQFHFPGHMARHTTEPVSVWHLNRHRTFSANYGINTPMLQLDEQFGTALDEPYL